jgi:hypothetical protein
MEVCVNEISYSPGPFYGRYFDTPVGRALWALLLTAEVRIRMQAACDAGVPAIAAVEKPVARARLIRARTEVPAAEKPQYDMYLRMAGHMVRQIMEFDGYRFIEDGVEFNGRIFRHGSLYEEVAPATVGAADQRLTVETKDGQSQL